MTKTSYEVTYDCLNCGWNGPQYFPAGKRAPQTVKCPNCSCNDARKRAAVVPYLPKRREPPDWPPVLPTPHPGPRELPPWWTPNPWRRHRQLWCKPPLDKVRFKAHGC